MHFRHIKSVKTYDCTGKDDLIMPRGIQTIPPRSEETSSNSPLGSISITNFAISAQGDPAVSVETLGFAVPRFLETLMLLLKRVPSGAWKYRSLGAALHFLQN